MDLITRRAPVRPNSFNDETRTIELVWAAGGEVERVDWATGERFIEVLDMSAGAIDLGRLNNGAPLLDTHGAYELGNILGVTERAWIEGGQGLASVRFSDRPEVQGIVGDVRSGVIRNVSVGYSVESWAKSMKGGKQVRTAIRWTPHEISLVPVPADAQAQVRSADIIAAQGEANMALKDEASAVVAEQTTRDQATTTAADPVQIERARIASLDAPIIEATERGLDGGAVTILRTRAISEGWTAEQFKAALFDAIPKRAAPQQGQAVAVPVVETARVGTSYDDPNVRTDAMATALARQVRPNAKEGSGGGKWQEYRGLRPSDMILDLALSRGERVSVRDRSALIERAFHTTSDFPLLLSAAANKLLEAGYNQAAPTYRSVFARRRFNDFKAHSFITAGDFPALLPIAEGGAIQAGTMSEKREQITPVTHGRQLAVTRQMLVNDDLGAFLDLASLVGPRIADYENATAFGLLNTATGDGPTLAEGAAAVFTTGRTNKAASGTAVTEAAVQAAFTAMMAVTSLDGIRLNIQPNVLLCSPIQRFQALKLATAVTPNAAAGANPLAGLFSVVADANIPNNRWYMFADPARAPVYVYGYVNDMDGPMIREGQPIGRDAIVLDVLLDFAVGAIDWRGGYYNSGAAPA